MRSANGWVFGAVIAMLAGSLWAQQPIAASVARMQAPTRVHFDMTATPPVLTPEQEALIAAVRDRGPLPHVTPLPEGTTAVPRSDSSPVRITPEPSGAPSAAPGTFTLFTNTSLGATIKANTSGLTGEPTIANSGPIVFATGNWWAAISSDGGQTFSFVNPYTQFPASFGGFCCDQMAVYDPSRDIFIWTLQYIASAPAGAPGQNLFRVAVARPSDAVLGNWWFYDFNSAANTEWDYPGLCLSNDFAYYFTNRGTYNSGSVNDSWVFRLPLDPLSIAAGFGYDFLDFGANGIGNLSWRCANGSRDVLYFGAHNSTSQVRIMHWAENSGSLFIDDVNLSAAWPNAVRACPTPDGRDWCGFDDGRIKAGWVGREKIGFLWNASAGSGFAVPYVEGMRVVESTRAYLDRPFIWNPTMAFQYPAAAVNARGDVGIVVHSSSSSNNPGFWVGIDDDFSRDAGFGPPGWEVLYVREGTQGPNGNRWGDYFSVQPSMPGGLGWTATGTTMQGCGGVGCKETRYELFGRERDLRGIADPPNIYTANSTTFAVGLAGTFTVMASGFPAPTFTRSGALPSGVNFDTTTGILSGTPGAGTGGAYPLTIGAVNGVLPNASQGFTLTVNQAPAISSANNVTFTAGAFATFTVTATGYPAPTFTRSGALPTGVNFNTTTGVLSGTPAAGTGGVYPLTIGAVNGVLPNASQGFTLTVNEAPAISSANNVTFTAGAFATFTVTATGYPAPTFTRSGALPTGVNFNTTTGVLSGTPAAGTGGVYPLTIGAVNGVLPNASQGFTLTVNEAPAISSANNVTLTAGTFGTFTVTATGYPAPTFTRSGALPTGVSFNTTTGVLSGTPAAGTGGVYPLTIGAVNGVLPNASQGFTLTVNEAPAITSADNVTLTVGTFGTFTVTATGYPAPTFTRSGALPTGVNFNTTTGVLSGTPAAGTGGAYPLTIGAVNGVLPNASQNFTLTIGTATRIIVPDGTSLRQTFSTYPETRWFAMTVEPGKTYVIDAVDPSGDLTANAIGTLNVFAGDGVSAPPEASVDCTAANGPRPPAVEVASDGLRCVLRTGLPTAGMQQNKRAVFVKVTRFDPALGGGAQFKIRAREATIYGRWLTAGYDYHVEVENTTGDALCVEVARYPASGLTYTAGPGWAGSLASFTLTVPPFGAVKQVIASGSLVGADSEGALRLSACAAPTNLLASGLHVNTYAFDPITGRFIYFFTGNANEGKTRSTW